MESPTKYENTLALALDAYDKAIARWRIVRDCDYHIAIEDNSPLKCYHDVVEISATQVSHITRPFRSHQAAITFIRLCGMAAALKVVDAESTREQILKFSAAFDRPINTSVVDLSVTDRLLLGKLLLEEVVEYATEGLGLTISGAAYDPLLDGVTLARRGVEPRFELTHTEGDLYDPIEAADGLGDINVVAHFNSNWHGWNLDAVTTEIHESNMSKLDDNGAPIINGESAGALDPNENPDAPASETRLFDPTKPPGKILKGPNFSEPNIAAVIYPNYSE